MRIALAMLGASLGLLALMLGNVQSADAPKQEWGTIKGQVILGDPKVPDAVPLVVNKDQKVCLKDGPVLSEEWIVDPKTKSVKNVFIWLADAKVPAKGAKWAKLPIHPSFVKSKEKIVTLTQPCCAFVPHVLAMRDDQTLEVTNTAPVAHNIHLTGAKVELNTIMPPACPPIEKEVAASDTPVAVSCDIHRWMKGYIRVFDHPYYAVTGADGKFEIKNAPAGDYRIMIWHEGMGWVAFENANAPGKYGKPITIKANDETDLGVFKGSVPKD